MKTLTALLALVAPARKSIVAGLSAAVMVLIAGASEGGLSTQEWLIAIAALLGAGVPTYSVKNTPKVKSPLEQLDAIHAQPDPPPEVEHL